MSLGNIIHERIIYNELDEVGYSRWNTLSEQSGTLLSSSRDELYLGGTHALLTENTLFLTGDRLSVVGNTCLGNVRMHTSAWKTEEKRIQSILPRPARFSHSLYLSFSILCTKVLWLPRFHRSCRKRSLYSTD